MFAFHEMQRSYISANYMATVLCAQAFAEHALAIHYVMSGADAVAKSGFKRLIERARMDGAIAHEVAERLHILRRMRNPYTHPAPGREGYDLRMHLERTHPLKLLEEDAIIALEAVALLVRRPVERK